jgi:hypothetical protein
MLHLSGSLFGMTENDSYFDLCVLRFSLLMKLIASTNGEEIFDRNMVA